MFLALLCSYNHLLILGLLLLQRGGGGGGKGHQRSSLLRMLLLLQLATREIIMMNRATTTTTSFGSSCNCKSGDVVAEGGGGGKAFISDWVRKKNALLHTYSRFLVHQVNYTCELFLLFLIPTLELFSLLPACMQCRMKAPQSNS